jgi:hypothetical protein
MNGKVRLPLTLSVWSINEDGDPVDPLAVLEQAFERLRRLGMIPRGAEVSLTAPPRSPTAAWATIRTTIEVEGSTADFASDVDRAVLAVQVLGLISRKEVCDA